MASMQELLLNLQSADKPTRTHAEAVYKSMLNEQRDQVCFVLHRSTSFPVFAIIRDSHIPRRAVKYDAKTSRLVHMFERDTRYRGHQAAALTLRH
jgi:hypothetical protein